MTLIFQQMPNCQHSPTKSAEVQSYPALASELEQRKEMKPDLKSSFGGFGPF